MHIHSNLFLQVNVNSNDIKYFYRKCADACLQLAQSIRKHTVPAKINSLEQTLGITAVSHIKMDYTAILSQRITNPLNITSESSLNFICEQLIVAAIFESTHKVQTKSSEHLTSINHVFLIMSTTKWLLKSQQLSRQGLIG